MNEDFQSLDLRTRANLVLKRGELLIHTNFYGAAVKLYNFKSRLIEVYYHPVTQKVMRVSLASPADLNKHLKDIRI